MVERLLRLAVCAAILVLPTVVRAGGEEEKGKDPAEEKVEKKEEKKKEEKVEKKVEKEGEVVGKTDVAVATITPRKMTEDEKAIRQKLESRKISFFFEDTAVSTVLQHLSDLTGTNFVIDIPEDKDTRISLRVKQMTMKNALSWVCKLAKIKHAVVDDAIYFGDKPVKKKILKIYTIRDLTHATNDFPGPQLDMKAGDDEGFAVPDVGEMPDSRIDPQVIVDTIKEVTEGIEEE